MGKLSRCTIAEYIRLEETAVDKHEYRDGEILSMSGGSPRHSLVISNFIGKTWSVLKGKPCRVYESNLRVRVARSMLYTYPDASIVCGPLQYDANDTSQTTIINPKVIVEVLSPGSETYDRGDKFDRYRMIDSLEEYILIRQSQPSVHTFLRQPEGNWSFAWFDGLEAVLKIRSIGIDLPLSDIYSSVEFDLAV